VWTAWFHSWFFSLLIVLLIFGLLTGFATLVYLLLCRIWGEENKEAREDRCNRDEEKERTVKEPPIRKTA
jgi:hypothetical protein